jgi:REP element-mobilizing transposase RayT
MSDSEPTEFQSFDPNAELFVTGRNLPHWFQTGAAIFVTFRTYDSIPKAALITMRDEFDTWLRNQSLPFEIAKAQFELTPQDRRNLLASFPPKIQVLVQRKFRSLFNQTLDKCHGECLLGLPENAKIVADAMLFYHRAKYDLDCFVVMPNHVHAIVQFRNGFDLRLVGQSWMRYTARMIHKRMGLSGIFWQAEPFDHIIRSGEQFLSIRKYIACNPRIAGIPNSQFLYWHN